MYKQAFYTKIVIMIDVYFMEMYFFSACQESNPRLYSFTQPTNSLEDLRSFIF